MPIDHRLYYIAKGRLEEAIQLYKDYGYKVQTEYLGPPVAFMRATAEGDDTYVHLWRYADETERLEKRNRLQADPRWKLYVEKLHAEHLLEKQDTRMLESIDFESRAYVKR